MNDLGLARLEAQIQFLVEGAFSQLFSRQVQPHDLAVRLARAMETNAGPARDNDPRAIAPDDFVIELNAAEQQRLISRQPALEALLSEHLAELANDLHLRLLQSPLVHININPDIEPGDLRVSAAHQAQLKGATSVLERIAAPISLTPANAHLVIDGLRIELLTSPLVTIGRGNDNTIVLDDPYASRYHAQLRLRFGVYTYFDINSQSGSLINDVRVHEHRLQAGDVIRLGRTQILYMDESDSSSTQTSFAID
ncbi:MAG: DUF3662 domain-containing protein [Anaerolineae bacterium]|nr:DUF3662 domain-containing protein [Anaerolineae bacterium]